MLFVGVDTAVLLVAATQVVLEVAMELVMEVVMMYALSKGDRYPYSNYQL